MSTIPTLAGGEIAELREAIRGTVFAPGDEGYDDARKLFNGMFDRRPLAVARCSSADDVAAAVNAAREALPQGSVVLHAAPAEVRASVDVWGSPPAALSLMAQMKDRLDPGRRLAPGRFVGGL